MFQWRCSINSNIQHYDKVVAFISFLPLIKVFASIFLAANFWTNILTAYAVSMENITSWIELWRCSTKLAHWVSLWMKKHT